MGNALAYEVFKEMKEDIKNESFGIYLDTWAYEDEYSHNDINNARSKFIELALNVLRMESLYLSATRFGRCHHE